MPKGTGPTSRRCRAIQGGATHVRASRCVCLCHSLLLRWSLLHGNTLGLPWSAWWHTTRPPARTACGFQRCPLVDMQCVCRRPPTKGGFCGKQFRDQRFLDNHLERKHMDKMVPHAHRCPTDYCDIVGCDCVPACTDVVVAATKAKCRRTLAACFSRQDDARLCLSPFSSVGVCMRFNLTLSSWWRHRICT